MHPLSHQNSDLHVNKRKDDRTVVPCLTDPSPSLCAQVAGDACLGPENSGVVKLSAVQIKNNSNFLLEFLCD